MCGPTPKPCLKALQHFSLKDILLFGRNKKIWKVKKKRNPNPKDHKPKQYLVANAWKYYHLIYFFRSSKPMGSWENFFKVPTFVSRPDPSVSLRMSWVILGDCGNPQGLPSSCLRASKAHTHTHTHTHTHAHPPALVDELKKTDSSEISRNRAVPRTDPPLGPSPERALVSVWRNQV